MHNRWYFNGKGGKRKFTVYKLFYEISGQQKALKGLGVVNTATA